MPNNETGTLYLSFCKNTIAACNNVTGILVKQISGGACSVLVAGPWDNKTATLTKYNTSSKLINNISF